MLNWRMDRAVVTNASRTAGLFVPKPSTCADCQRCGTVYLGIPVRQRPLASAAVGGDCYSLGYSASARLRLGNLDANYWRDPARGRPVQPSACMDGSPGQPWRAFLCIRTGRDTSLPPNVAHDARTCPTATRFLAQWLETTFVGQYNAAFATRQ
jgi:hypothetical protein